MKTTGLDYQFWLARYTRRRSWRWRRRLVDTTLKNPI
jgi:hypothetical protein